MNDCPNSINDCSNSINNCPNSINDCPNSTNDCPNSTKAVTSTIHQSPRLTPLHLTKTVDLSFWFYTERSQLSNQSKYSPPTKDYLHNWHLKHIGSPFSILADEFSTVIESFTCISYLSACYGFSCFFHIATSVVRR